MFLLAATDASAQTSAIQTAETLRAERRFAEAVTVLRAHLEAHPDDGHAARLLAQTLYWMRDDRAAAAVYEQALVRHPDDARIRLEYARMLAETGDPQRARRLLTPLRDVPAARADALAMLGTLEYWDGDLAAAASLLEQAIASGPAHPEAVRQLREIRAATSPWLRAVAGIWHDDQPLTRTGVLVEGGWFATPGTPIRLHVQPARYSTEPFTANIWTADAEVEHYAAGLRLDTMARAGIVWRQTERGESPDFTGAAALGVRLPQHITVRMRGTRAAYLATPPSLVNSIVTTTLSAELRLDHRGWLGEAAFGRQYFPDDNAVRTAHAWLLAPFLRRSSLELQAGYAFAADHADETRFAAGAYFPYHTPAHVVKHSVLGAVTVTGLRAAVRVGGSYAFRAAEDRPFVSAAPPGQVSFARREFSPWEARGSVEFNQTGKAGLRIGTHLGHGAFYRWSTLDVAMFYRFGPHGSTGDSAR